MPHEIDYLARRECGQYLDRLVVVPFMSKAWRFACGFAVERFVDPIVFVIAAAAIGADWDRTTADTCPACGNLCGKHEENSKEWAREEPLRGSDAARARWVGSSTEDQSFIARPGMPGTRVRRGSERGDELHVFGMHPGFSQVVQPTLPQGGEALGGQQLGTL